MSAQTHSRTLLTPKNSNTSASTPDDGVPNTLLELKALSKIIQDSIDTIEATVASKNMEFPSAYTPLTMESEAARMLPEVEKACALIVSATAQLAFAVRSPLQSIVTVALQVRAYFVFGRDAL